MLAGQAYDDGPFQPIPAIIEQVARLHPGRPAVSYRDTTLTYLELDQLANGLAADLSMAGVAVGSVVAVPIGNSWELPIAWLALMKLGAVFVPLDPDWPASRLQTTLGVLDTPHVLESVTPRPSPDPPGVRLTGDDLIYGMFTSGTTGTPKCALNRHAGLTNRFQYMSRYFRATGDEIVLQNSRHTYDSAVWQLFWPLTTGGRTVIPERGEFLDLERTIALIARHRITMTDFVPSVFNTLVSIVDGDSAQLARIASLRELVVGGEEINPRMAHRLRELLPEVRITNGYGPTEASIGMIFHAVSPEDGDAIPLGRPIDNCYATVVDDRLQPVPSGEAGELLIAGVCLGAGYLHDPVKTEEVFIPYSLVPGGRAYRTGDLARFDAAGRLHFLGRRDNQVKIGGVRIELGEVEAAASTWPGVTHCKALAVTAGGKKSLALFVSGHGLTRAAVRQHLAALLPRHHLPQHVLVRESMPVNSHGKVDGAALLADFARELAAEPDPGPDLGPAGLAGSVLRLFQETLAQPHLGLDEDFRHAGGDSLQAVALITALRQETGIGLGVQDLLDCPTPAAMARMLGDRRAEPPNGAPEVPGWPAPQASPAVPEAPAAATGIPAQRQPVMADLGQARTLPVSAAYLPRSEPRHVFVTGATGFVGTRLIFELLTATELHLSCLVRGSDDANAQQRVVGGLVEAGLWQDGFAARISAHAGDLARPRLGLPQATWDHVAAQADLLLHNGALVNLVYDYSAHRGPNVLGTAEVLKLAMAQRQKPLHYVSTLGVLDTEAARLVDAGEPPVAEAVDLSQTPSPPGGYSRSKWLAELMLRDAARAGASVTIYRLGEIMPGDDGRPNPRALTHLLLSAFHRLGVSPDVPMRSDYTPVDYTARRVVAVLRDPDAWGGTLHVFYPESVCYADVLNRVAYPITRVSCREFVARLAEAVEEQRELRTLLGILAVLPEMDEAMLRGRLGGLLADNPRLFRKDRCSELEQRWSLPNASLHRPLAAYRDHLSGGMLCAIAR